MLMKANTLLYLACSIEVQNHHRAIGNIIVYSVQVLTNFTFVSCLRAQLRRRVVGLRLVAYRWMTKLPGRDSRALLSEGFYSQPNGERVKTLKTSFLHSSLLLLICFFLLLIRPATILENTS
jgi:hypothetical protein